MEVEVGDHLPSVGSAVYHQAIAISGDALLLRQPVRYGEEVPHERLIRLGEVGDGGYVFAGYHQYVCGGFGVDVGEGNSLIILIEDVAFYFAVGDFAEDAVHFLNLIIQSPINRANMV